MIKWVAAILVSFIFSLIFIYYHIVSDYLTGWWACTICHLIITFPYKSIKYFKPKQ